MKGPYSSGVLVDKTLYVSGTLGVDPKTGKLVSENAAEQAKQALVNVGYILEEAGCSYVNFFNSEEFFLSYQNLNYSISFIVIFLNQIRECCQMHFITDRYKWFLCN